MDDVPNFIILTVWVDLSINITFRIGVNSPKVISCQTFLLYGINILPMKVTYNRKQQQYPRMCREDYNFC